MQPPLRGGLDPLSAFAVAHGTDKYGEHFYTPHYHRHLAALRERPVVLLEAGIGGYGDPESGGESLAMWRDYFPRGRIIGIDIVPKRLDLGARVVTRQGSMADPGFIAELGREFGPFDVVIDDGSHISADTIRFVDAVFPLLAEDGFLAIEDTQTSYWPAFGGSLSPGAATTMNYVKRLVDEVDHAERALAATALPAHPFATRIRAIHRFHNLVLIEKGDNRETSNFATDRAADRARAAALDEYAALLDLGGGSAGTVMACARMLLEDGEGEAALARLQQGLARFPNSAPLRIHAARTALRLDDTARAVGHLRRALALPGGGLDAHVLIATTHALRDAFPDLAHLLQHRVADPATAPRLLLQAARAFEGLRLKEAARACLDRITADRGAEAGLLAQDLSEAYRRLGATGRALEIQETRDAAELLPAEAVRRGALLRAAGRHEEAVEMLSAALAQDWHQPRAHAERSRALAALGRDVEAMEAAKAFLALAQRGRGAA